MILSSLLTLDVIGRPSPIFRENGGLDHQVVHPPSSDPKVHQNKLSAKESLQELKQRVEDTERRELRESITTPTQMFKIQIQPRVHIGQPKN